MPTREQMWRQPVQETQKTENEILNPLDYAMASRDEDVPIMVRTALEQENCILAFQPVVQAGMNDRVVFYEGLIRVKDEHVRIIPAHLFMPGIEETDLGREIDAASLRLALQFLRRNPQLRLSVNVSARSLGDGKWRRVLHQHLMSDDTIGERLIMEFSEKSAMMLHEVVQRFMFEMQSKGVAFALDDFGAGLTAFSHLQDFFFDIVKIDKGFIHDITNKPDNQVLTAALISVAHQFDMIAVATGIETEEEAAILASLGADCMQGFHIGAPLLRL